MPHTRLPREIRAWLTRLSVSRDVGWKKAISSIRFNKGIIALIVASPMPAGSVHGVGGRAEGSRAALLAPACPQTLSWEKQH